MDCKDQRVQLRLDEHAKRVLRRAARHRQTSLSQFVLGTALEEAERVIREHEVETLSDGDWQRFMAALDDPPGPNDRLRAAFADYAKMRG